MSRRGRVGKDWVLGVDGQAHIWGGEWSELARELKEQQLLLR